MNSKAKNITFSIAPSLAAATAAASVAALPPVMASPQVSLAPAAATVTTHHRAPGERRAAYLLKVTSPFHSAGTDEAFAHRTAMAPAYVAPKSYATQREKKRAAAQLAALAAAATPAASAVAAATPAAATPAAAAAPAAVKAPATQPRVADGRVAQTRTTPVVLGSRHRDRALLAQLEAELQRSEKKLTRAGADLSEGQRQLASFGNELNRAMLEAGPDAKGLHPFVKVAQRYAGTPYVWGGESRTGFDCSGFIIRVMRDLGYKALPHSAAEQFRYGMPVAQKLLKPGDLVFFANTYKPGISHVGIYLGKRRFIHAAGTGQGTIVSSLDAPKFQSKYAGARRLMAAR